MSSRNKKSLKRGLTASRKKARRKSVRAIKLVNVLDGLAECRNTLLILASLLESCGEPMEPWQVSGAGSLVTKQSRRLAELINTLDEETR